MVTFLPMFKENKTTGLYYEILVTLRQQLFWEVASAERNGSRHDSEILDVKM